MKWTWDKTYNLMFLNILQMDKHIYLNLALISRLQKPTIFDYHIISERYMCKCI
jgi:hypothetical protein